MAQALPRHYASGSDVGRDREGNEDARAEYLLDHDGVLLVVADGMGGHEHGEVASKIAIEALGQIFQNSPAPDPRDKLKNGFLVANQRILGEIEKLGVEGMGTTAVAAYVRGPEAYVAHVGDSRLYQIRAGKIVWKTLDHTRVQRMVEMGILSAEDAKDHPDANVVSRALGFKSADGAAVEPEVQDKPLDLLPGDSLVLCSDGLYDGVTDQEIADTLTGKSAEAAVKALIDLANERGGHDNITVTVLHYGAATGGRSAPPGPQSVNRRRVTASDDVAGAPRPEAAEPPAKGAPAAPRESTPPEGGRRVSLAITIAVLGLGLGVLAVLKLRGGGKKPAPAPVMAVDAGTMAAARDAGGLDGAAADGGGGGLAKSPLYVPPAVPKPAPKRAKGDAGVGAAAAPVDAGVAPSPGHTAASGPDGGAGVAHGGGHHALGKDGGVAQPVKPATTTPPGKPAPTSTPPGKPAPTTTPPGKPAPATTPPVKPVIAPEPPKVGGKPAPKPTGSTH